MQSTQKALVAVESPIARDPRVRRQIQWLADAGFTVDCLALGAAPPESLRDYFAIAPPAGRQPLKSVYYYAVARRRSAFRALTLSRFPDEVRARVRRGEYDLIVLNDRHFSPWVDDPSEFSPPSAKTRVHLDLHEYFVPTIPSNSPWNVITAGYYRWARASFSHPRFTSRSTVNSAIARTYERELGVEDIAIVRNSPEYVECAPTPVDDHRVRMIHHGAARWDRGISEIVEAMEALDGRFEMTFMLLGDPAMEAELGQRIEALGARVRIVPPVPTEEITAAINQYDLEVMFYPPRTKNLEMALPNKLFEAIQARLGLVIGESAMMAEVVREHANGVIVTGWSSDDLARTLNAITPAALRSMKDASGRAARSLNAENERQVFLRYAAGLTNGRQP